MPSALLLRLFPTPVVVPAVVVEAPVVVAAVVVGAPVVVGILNWKNMSCTPMELLQMSIVNIHWLSRQSTSSVAVVAAVTYDVDVVVSV